MKQAMVAMLLLTWQGAAISADQETWICYGGAVITRPDGSVINGVPALTASVNPDRVHGSILVAEVEQAAAFKVAGLNRRWDFGCNRKTCQYALILQPDGTGLYVDFSVSNKPSQRFVCNQTAAISN